MNVKRRFLMLIVLFTILSPQLTVFAESVNDVLVNSKEELLGKGIVEGDPYEYFEFTTHPDRYAPGEAKDLKYFVWHDTGNYKANARGNANNFQNNPVLEGHEPTSAKIIIDDKEAFKMMDWHDREFATGGGTNDINNYTSISIEVAVGDGIDLHRAVANGIHFYRNVVKPLFPNLQIVRHYDANTVRGNPKNCPLTINEEVSWWTWEKVKALCENNDPIPFIDYIPVDEENRQFIINRFDFVYLDEDGKEYPKGTYPKKSMPTIREYVDGEIKNVTSKIKISDSKDESNEIVKSVEFDFNKSNEGAEPIIVNPEENSNKGIFSKLFNIFKKEKSDEESEESVKKDTIEDIKLNGYEHINFKSIIKYISAENPEFEKINGISVEAHIENFKKACEYEDINPWLILWQMEMTNNFKFTGVVQSKQNNYGGLKTQEGDFLSFTNNEQGNMAFVQCFKKASGKQVALDKFKNFALDIIPEGNAKNVYDYGKMLGYEDEFLNRVEKLYIKFNKAA